jgi:hypothetical protein
LIPSTRRELGRGQHAWRPDPEPRDEHARAAVRLDLLKVDARKGLHDHPVGWLRGLFVGRRTQECYAWGAAIHSPFDSVIVRAVDGVAERGWISNAVVSMPAASATAPAVVRVFARTVVALAAFVSLVVAAGF